MLEKAQSWLVGFGFPRIQRTPMNRMASQVAMYHASLLKPKAMALKQAGRDRKSSSACGFDLLESFTVVVIVVVYIFNCI